MPHCLRHGSSGALRWQQPFARRWTRIGWPILDWRSIGVTGSFGKTCCRKGVEATVLAEQLCSNNRHQTPAKAATGKLADTACHLLPTELVLAARSIEQTAQRCRAGHC